MAGFPKSQRQAIIDGYLAQTGANMFVAAEFIDWLQGETDHEAYPWFFAKDDAAAAREHRIDLARRMASGLRIVARVEETRSQVLQITTREYPAYISPMSGRRAGGGYARFEPGDPDSMAELRRQGATALRSWLHRYRGAYENAGVDLTPLEKIAAAQTGGVALAG